MKMGVSVATTFFSGLSDKQHFEPIPLPQCRIRFDRLNLCYNLQTPSMAGTNSTAFSSSLSTVCTLQNRHASQPTTFLGIPLCQKPFLSNKNSPHKFLTVAVTKGSAESSKSDEKIPSWAKPDSEEPPPWAQNEAQNKPTQQGFVIPFYVYLLASAITAIAAIGSIFEYVNQKPVFGVLSSDSVFYTPLLGFFAFTGVPTSAFLWFKSVQAANKEAEEQDKRDGY